VAQIQGRGEEDPRHRGMRDDEVHVHAGSGRGQPRGKKGSPLRRRLQADRDPIPGDHAVRSRGELRERDGARGAADRGVLDACGEGVGGEIGGVGGEERVGEGGE